MPVRLIYRCLPQAFDLNQCFKKAWFSDPNAAIRCLRCLASNQQSRTSGFICSYL